MNWMELMQDALDYIERNLLEKIDAETIGKAIHLSPIYFQKGFTILTGIPVGEYIRNRRLSEAGMDLITTKCTVIELAMKYGYNNAASFTRAFTRFHGFTPTQIRSGFGTIRAFYPLKLELMLKGGENMDYRIETMPAFDVVAYSRDFDYDQTAEITDFWKEVKSRPDIRIMGHYGISFDETMEGNRFRYSVADPYEEEKMTEQTEKITIPELTWAKFAIRGFSPERYSEMLRRVFQEWLPNAPWQIAAGYNVEFYSDPSRYPLGMADPDYRMEMWMPVVPKN